MPSKLEKFAELDVLKNVFQNFNFKEPQLMHEKAPIQMKGLWHKNYFGNQNPIVLELACGRENLPWL